MSQPTHIIDPYGEVVIVLTNANAPFALFSQSSEPETSHDHGYNEGRNLRKRKLLVSPLSQSPEAATEPESGTEPIAELEPKLEPEPEPDSVDPESFAPEFPDYGSFGFEPAERRNVEPELEAEPAVRRVEDPVKMKPTFEPPVDECFRIQVSARHLTFASSVFDKMLNGGWKESVTCKEQGSIEIAAENWDVDALLILLHAIHAQNHRISRQISLEMLAKVALLTDYSACQEVVSIWAETWISAMREVIPSTYCRDLVLWLWISWFFRLPAQFKKATSVAMSCGYSPVDVLQLPIPYNVIRLLDEKRRQAIASLILHLDQIRDDLLGGTRGCNYECRSIMYGALTHQMQSNALLSPRPTTPFSDLKYKDLVQKILSFISPKWISKRQHYSYEWHDCPGSTFNTLLGELDDTIEGLDLNSLVSQ